MIKTFFCGYLIGVIAALGAWGVLGILYHVLEHTGWLS